MLPKKDFIIFYRNLKNNEIKEFPSIISMEIGTKNVKIKSYSDIEDLFVDNDTFIKLYMIIGKEVTIIEGIMEDKIELLFYNNNITYEYRLNRLPQKEN
jgi:hypothetical protein